MPTPGIDFELWTMKGIPYEEVRARLSERTNENCKAAMEHYFSMLAAFFGQDEAEGTLDGMLERIKSGQSAEEIMKYHDEHNKRGAEELDLNIPQSLMDQHNELNALTIEFLIRTRNRIIPANPSNN